LRATQGFLHKQFVRRSDGLCVIGS
jgi:hypothetical protein